MFNICVFAGTADGRKLVELLCKCPVKVTACVATEYGETLLEPAENLNISAERLSQAAMEELFCRERFDMVIDATHPYSANVTDSIEAACKSTDTEYLRLLRDEGAKNAGAVYTADIQETVDYLNSVRGNIFLATGSRDLIKYTGIKDFAQRVYVRVLPMQESLELCAAAGVKPSHIIAMQGPFSTELNTAMLKNTSAEYLVTKDGGKPGGFQEKMSAAAAAGAKVVVIGRPAQKPGLEMSAVLRLLEERFGLRFMPEVCIVGIGPGSPKAMTRETEEAIENAELLIGAARMLDAVSNPGKKKLVLIVPNKIADYILEHREFRKITVLMSGDSGFYSGTKKLLQRLDGCSLKVLPGLSSLSYLCARLGTSYEDVYATSLHGRDTDIVQDIRRNKRTFALLGGNSSATTVCRQLCDFGFGSLKVSVGSKLSYPDEEIIVGTAQELCNKEFAPLSVMLVENPDAEY